LSLLTLNTFQLNYLLYTKLVYDRRHEHPGVRMGD
jgi:hypothetical protein